MARNKRQSTGKNKVMNVRITDPAGGTDGLRIDRMISATKTSESQIRVVIGDVFDLGIPSTADTSGAFDFQSIVNTDDFQSLSAQYNLFRVTAIKVDIYDTNPNVPAYNGWGMIHEVYESATPPALTRANIADLPDSRVISGGTGQTTLYWLAHGATENHFQETTSSGPSLQKYGGLRYYVGLGSTAVPKYTVQVHAVVDFRGRR